MNYATKIKTAMASVLCVMVGMAFAGTTVTNDVQTYGATFEASEAADNDFAYKPGQKIANYTNELGTAGWFAGSEDDESVISNRTATVEGLGSQYLLLNTDAETLTNKLDTTVKAGVNTAMAGGARVDASLYDGNVATYEGAVFESDVKFVASDTLDAGIPGGQDATKFAIYAYCNEDADPVTTNLVVFHAVRPKRGAITYTNYVFSSVDIDTTAYTHLKVVMKQVSNADKLYDVFSVTVGSGDNAVTLENEFASEVRFGDAATGNWFFTVEDAADDSKLVSSLNFKGTGEIDNIKISQKVKETYAAIVDGVKYETWATAAAKATTNAADIADAPVVQSFEAGTLYLEQGKAVKISGTQPTLAVPATVDGWKVTQATADGVTTYVSEIDSFTVIFVAENGTTIYETNITANAAIAYVGAEQTKASDATYVYDFAGWATTAGGEPVATLGIADAAKTFYAVFTETAGAATANGVSYKTLADALAAAGHGGTVKLLGNAVVTSKIVVNDDIIIDLGGYSITNTADIAVFQADAGNVVVTNGTLCGRVNCYDSSTLTIAANTTVEGFVIAWGSGTYGEAGCLSPTFNLYGTINAGGNNAILDGYGDASRPTINIFDGAVCNSDSTAVLIRSGADLAMSGGTINGGADNGWGIWGTNATVAVTGGEINAGWGIGVKDGTVSFDDATINADNRGIEAMLGTAVTVSGGEINAGANGSGIGLWEASSLTMTDGDITSGSFGIFNNGLEAVGTTMNISGGMIASTNATACGIYQAGKGSLTLSGTAVVSGADAVEVRAGTVQVLNNAQLIATAPYTAPSSNGGGSSGHGGVALLVSQHTTAQNVSATVDGGTLTGAVAFAEATLESQNDSTKVSGSINGGTIYGEVESEDLESLIPSTSTAIFDNADAEGVEPGYALIETGENTGLYAIQKVWIVTYANYDGTVLYAVSNLVTGAATPAYVGETPVKPADASGVYTFTGFAPAADASVTSNTTYTAQFTSTDSKATVITITDAGATTNVVGYYASLADAIRAADDGETVVLLADETADATKTTQADRLVVTKQITIDFGPYTYSVPGSLEPTDNWCALFIDADTVVKGTTGGIDCLDEEDPSDPCGVYAFNVRNNAKLTIEGGVYHGGGTVIQAQLGDVVINGGTFSVTPYDAPYYYDFALNCVDANYKAGNAGFEINGGTFIGFDPQNNTSEGAGTDYTDDGYVAIDDGNGNFVVQAGYNVTFDANGGTPAPEAQRVAAGGTATAPAAPAKAGCTFAGWTLNNAAYNFATVLRADIELVAAYDAAKATVISVAGTVTNYYPTLAAAVAAAEDGDTVVLLANVNEAVVNNNAHSFTIDLNGKTWSADSDVLATTAGTITIEATNGGTMTTEAAQCCAVWAKGGDVVINGGTFTSKDNEEATIYVSNADSVITINGGTFENTDPRPYRWKASLQALTLNVLNDLVGQHLIINGGTFIGNDPQLGDDTAGGTSAQSDVKFVSEGYVAIADGNGNFVVQPGWNVTFDANGGTPAPEAQRVAAGSTATAPADPSKADGAFAGWTLDGNAYDFDTVLDADITLVATYEGYVAQIVGGASYTSLQAALDAAKENNLQQANIELLANASITISRNGNVLGGNSTTNITINGNGYELNVIRNGTWAQFNTANANAELVISNITFTSEFSGTATGWASEPLQNPNHNIAFNCVVTLKDVVSDNALSFWKDATLDTVTVSDSANVYPIWIHTTADEISINNLTVNSMAVGRGIKVDDSYVSGWGGTPTATTEIDINNSTFNMDNVRKSAVLVGSAYPVVITASGNDITNVGADTKNLVWVDERDSAAQNYGLVSVNGEQPGIEGGSSNFAASYSTNGTWIAGYYKVLADAVAIADADDTLTLQKDVTETFTVAKELTITLNGFTAENVTAGEGYTRTVTETTYVFAEAATGFNVGDENVGDFADPLTAEQAAWLNRYLGEGEGLYSKEQLAAATDLEKKYLLNVNPITGNGSLTVTGITVGGQVKVTVTLARTEGGTAVGTREINGVLELWGTTGLGSSTPFAKLVAATISDADFSEGNTQEITFEGSAKFFKAYIVEPPVAVEP